MAITLIFYIISSWNFQEIKTSMLWSFKLLFLIYLLYKYSYKLHITRGQYTLRIWLWYSRLTSSLQPLNGIPWNLTGSNISTSSTKFDFQDDWKTMRALLASYLRTHFDFFSATVNGIQWNFTGSKSLTSSANITLFGPACGPFYRVLLRCTIVALLVNCFLEHSNVI